MTVSRSARRAAWLAAALVMACGAPERGADGAAPSTPGAARGDSLTRIADTARIRGAADAPVWIVEMSDFQCPYCRIWHEETYPLILREYVETGKARLAFLNLPLPNHQHAVPAAEAAMCAGLQGKFWPMHDAIFASQSRWTGLPSADSVFTALAAGVGLDVASWRGCLRSDATLPLIEADRDRAIDAGANSTPSFFIGDARLSGALPADSFRVAIDAALARAAGGGAAR
jgi:protein-disulfide isomerase